MSKLHEILAVEGDLEGVSKKIVTETIQAFKKDNLFIGSLRKLEMFDEDRQQDNIIEEKEITTTVPERIKYTLAHLVKYWNAVYQKEKTNQIAYADVVIGDEIIAKNVPATFLLGMESKLKALRSVLDDVPTLASGKKWELDESKGSDIYRTQEDDRFKTEKTIRHKVLYDAVVKDGVGIPAQIDKWEETQNVGKYKTTTWCGMISPADKSQIIQRVDNLIRAVKKARQRANSTEVIQENVGNAFRNYILGKN